MSELKIKMIKIDTIIKIFKINIFKLVNKSIKDEIKIIQDDLLKLTDSYIEIISEKSKSKENEILQI